MLLSSWMRPFLKSATILSGRLMLAIVRSAAQMFGCREAYLIDESWLCTAPVRNSVRRVNCAVSSASDEADMMKE